LIPLRHVAVGFGARDLRLELRVIDLEQSRARADFLTFAHENLHDPAVDLGTELDRLHGLDLARGRDRVHDGIADRGGDLDGHGEAARSTGASACRGVGLFARGGCRKQEQNS